MTAFLKNGIQKKGQKHLSVSSFQQKQQQRKQKHKSTKTPLSYFTHFTKQATETTHASVYLTTHPPPKTVMFSTQVEGTDSATMIFCFSAPSKFTTDLTVRGFCQRGPT